MKRIAMIVLSSLVLLVSAASCVPVQPQAQAGGSELASPSGGGGGGGGGEAAAGGPEHDTACRAACRVFDQCGKQPYDRCLPECAGMETHRLERFASFTCEELHAVLTGTVGTQCMSHGKDDCRPLGPQYTCCGGNEAMRQPGQCLDVGVCNMPRR